jgi:hypothetical protein
MLPETLKALSAHPPPKFYNLRFQKHADCYSEIKRLETLLGVSHSEPPNNLGDANARAVELERLVTLSLTKTPPAPAATHEAFPGAAIIAALDSISHPADKVEFYRANKAEVNRAYRDAPEAPVSSCKLTGIAVIDALSSLDGRERVKYYRKNKKAIDAAYQNQNL